MAFTVVVPDVATGPVFVAVKVKKFPVPPTTNAPALLAVFASDSTGGTV